MKKCRVCMVSTVQTSFWGSKERLYEKKYIPEMQVISQEFGFELTAFTQIITDEKEAEKIENRIREGEFDFLLVQVSTFAAGDIILPLCRTGVRMGLWAVPELTEKGAIPNNSFCGINMYGSIMKQYLGKEGCCKWFFGEIQDPWFKKRLQVTIRALTALKNMEGARVALIGGIAPGFHDFYFDERQTRSRLGVTVSTELEFSDIFQKAQTFPSERVKELTEEMKRECRCVAKDLTEETLENTARVYMAFENLIKENGYDAIAISCWPKYRKELGIVVCSVIGRLLENGMVAACEGDVDSAISMLLLKYLSGHQPMLMDLSKFDREEEAVLMWHCGSAPHSYADENGVYLDGHYKPGSCVTCMDEKRVSSVHNMYYGQKPVTVARFTNNYKNMLTFTGEFINKEDKSYDGSRGWLGKIASDKKAVSVEDLINTILVQGFQHHYPIVAGDVEEELQELMAWLGIRPLEWIPFRNYFQTAR